MTTIEAVNTYRLPQIPPASREHIETQIDVLDDALLELEADMDYLQSVHVERTRYLISPTLVDIHARVAASDFATAAARANWLFQEALTSSANESIWELIGYHRVISEA